MNVKVKRKSSFLVKHKLDVLRVLNLSYCCSVMDWKMEWKVTANASDL